MNRSVGRSFHVSPEKQIQCAAGAYIDVMPGFTKMATLALLSIG